MFSSWKACPFLAARTDGVGRWYRGPAVWRCTRIVRWRWNRMVDGIGWCRGDGIGWCRGGVVPCWRSRGD